MFSSVEHSKSNSNRDLYNNLGRNHLYYLNDVSVSFGNIHALRSIELTISHGEILFLTGPSGAGKTTLLNVLAKDASVTSGRVVRPDMTKCFVSRVYQDLRLCNDLTCEENLRLAFDRTIYKSKKHFEIDFDELTKIFSIRDRLHLKIYEANGGLKQKIAMIRALLSKPNILLADEPSASLDAASAMRMFEILEYLNQKRGLTLVWASHNKDLVKQFSGRIIHIEKGRIIHSGHACFI